MFKPRGIRQGCPISANLFVLIVKILANAIRQNPRIQGIKIQNLEFKISQYADDTVIYLADDESIKISFIILEMFGKCSGLRANKDKSEAMRIGASSNFKHKDISIKWTNTLVKSLGIYIGNDRALVSERNFQEKLQKIEALLKMCNLRKLTPKGKVLVINTLIIPNLLYVSSVLHTPKWVIAKFKELIIQFIWNNKTPKVKYSTMIADISEGGLKLQDISTKIESLSLGWVKSMITEKNVPWQAYLAKHFANDITKIPFYNINNKDIPHINDEFYTDLLSTWSTIHYRKPVTPEEIYKPILWCNSHIKTNHNIVHYKNQTLR
jgi:hypothetical protein